MDNGTSHSQSVDEMDSLASVMDGCGDYQRNLVLSMEQEMLLDLPIREGFKGLEQDKDNTRIKGQKSRGYRIKRIRDYKKRSRTVDQDSESPIKARKEEEEEEEEEEEKRE
ncbi:hypothetical protein PPACK8108_LOCUS9850 [Phakopsora pachyrhizi]|uniref:Uncharacterized protein n=1 Tax=Phakopsora pachyrhizi TaxID=170000 RepID=A0AAV0AXB9_PHAPC|nr:hypothetical protein PPACK8108_LOCUS9850 [Phakopsora pachyrhizi]